MIIDGNLVVVVTGGASGMGFASAEWFAKKGAKVALFDTNIEQAQTMAKKIGAIAFECDVRSAESVEKAIASAREINGPARVGINCAGIAPAGRIVGKNGPMPLENFKRVIEINLIGTFNVMRLLAADMTTLEPVTESGERGVIINTASVAAYEGQIGQAAYSASKGGVVSMGLPSAREFAQFGIRVNTIAPGIIGTPMMTAMPQAVQDSLAASIPFPKRLGYPEEYARLAGHIVENELINGAVIRLDGAIRMAPK
jgi:NAD(P)-dependent dehydrogenase (short-subunit alcohol dehydrogenase family)